MNSLFMPTSSQSRILSVVDYQLLQQQTQQSVVISDTITNPSDLISIHQTSLVDSKRRESKDDHRSLNNKRDSNNNRSPSPSNLSVRRQNLVKHDNNISISQSPQRTDCLRMSTVYLNDKNQNELKTATQSFACRRGSTNAYDDDDDELDTEFQFKQRKSYPFIATPGDKNNSSTSSSPDLEYESKNEQKTSVLNEYARRLLILGTIRPSKSFYKDLPAADVEHLMEYFRRMRKSNRQLTSEEINQELKTKFIEYKPKIFFDSSVVTKSQVISIEKIIEQFADKIRTHKAELAKLDNPIRFVIKEIGNDTPLTIIPREFNDCFLTLVTRADPLRKSGLITEFVQDKLLEDVNANALDISYFPGGINYDLPYDEINENGQMKLETYQKLKKRLNNRTVWHFDGPPEKKPNALLAIIPLDSSINMNHQRLLDYLYDQLKSVSANESFDRKDQILSIEFVPLSCILNSTDTPNQFIVDCDTIETKVKLMEQPLKIKFSKQTIIIELRSYDDEMHKEYEKSIKAEKYQELIKSHDEATKRTSSMKQ